MITIEITFLVLIIAVSGLAIGFKMGKDSISRLSEEDDTKAFEEAKAEYLEWFHKRFSPKGEALAEAYNVAVAEEAKRLKQENKELRKQIKKLEEEK